GSAVQPESQSMKPPRLNTRFLFWSLLLAVLVVGSVLGYRWWITRPDYLYSSAQSNFDRGRERFYQPPNAPAAAAIKNDLASARSSYESALQQVEMLLSKDDKHSGAHLLRSKILEQMIYLQEAENTAAGKKDMSEEDRKYRLWLSEKASNSLT